jgi:release factor glutamine methyltransferase
LSPSKSTIQDTILDARQNLKDVSDKPGSDAQLLLADVLGKSRAWIMAHPEIELDSQQGRDFMISLERYRSGEPLPYVLGWWEFYGRRFRLNNSVLIPRPETEHLVEESLRILFADPTKRTAIDVGTGSGCIAVTLLAEVSDLQMIATDISFEALTLARENAEQYGVSSRLHFVQMDLASAIATSYDLVCANLPYIPSSSLQSLEVAQDEPLLALNGGEDGLFFIETLLQELPHLLLPGGSAFFEIEAGTSERVLNLAKAHISNAEFRTVCDLAGYNRVLAIELKRP